MCALVRLTLVALLLLGLTVGAAWAEGDPAQAILEQMTVAERVGQLFIVSYVGSDTGPNSDVARLVREERVGGVVLLAANQNFTNDESAPMQVRGAVEQLQRAALEQDRLPLIVAIDHEGDGWPYSRLTGGTTPLPSPMSVGATWNVELAREVGAVTGSELAAAGINMLLGPSVDVLSSPLPSSKGDLGTRVFGGDPYWVGRMGRAYIAGVHEGSAGRIVTVAKHFPGHGGSDRLPDDEVATVDKSLQELRRIELAPFFAVTRSDSPDDPAATDALMSSHIRYRGFQGNIRQFTAPISFDAQGLRTILAEPDFDAWRERGVIVSDSLGVPAVKNYFDPTSQSFPHRQIARDALIAGNDLLILAQYAREDAWAGQLANMRDTLHYFREQYTSDQAFAQRVDQALLKVIRLKLKLYPEFVGGAAALPELPAPVFGQRGDVTARVAEQALTLLFPRTKEELEERLPRAPLRGEPIVIFTDARKVRDCFDCPYYPLIETDALQKAILQRYGPQGTNQITEAQIISFSFEDLELFLGVPDSFEKAANPEAARMRADAVRALVEGAAWVLLVMQDINLSPAPGTLTPRYPESDAAQLLLDAASGSLLNKRVVAFAMNVPYQFDTTEVSKLSAFFALYSKQDAFVDVAARALFRDIAPEGAPPVTVEAVNYDLPTQLEPSPEQALALHRVGSGSLTAPTTVTVETDVILDRNGHPVPDGTAVEIVARWPDEPEVEELRTRSTTINGVVRVTVPIKRDGTLEVRAEAVQAVTKDLLLFTVRGPTPTPTVTTEATATPVGTATPQAVDTQVAASPESLKLLASESSIRPSDLLGLRHFFTGITTAVLLSSGSWWVSRSRTVSERLRCALLVIIGALGGYLLWGMTGASGAVGGVVVATVFGALVGYLVARTQEA